MCVGMERCASEALVDRTEVVFEFGAYLCARGYDVFACDWSRGCENGVIGDKCG